MIPPADIVAAKLLVQLGWVTEEALRGVMRQVDADPDSAVDMISRLGEVGLLEQPQVKRIRRYQAMFDHVRREAVYLKLVEKNLPSLDKNQISELIARVERDSYRRRLGAVMMDKKLINERQANSLERRARTKIQKEDLAVQKRYRKQDFAGVGRPLIPVAGITTSVFKVSELFRSKLTMKRVERAKLRLEEEEANAARTAQHEFVPVDLGESMDLEEDEEEDEDEYEEEDEDELDEEEQEALGKLNTARFRLKTDGPAPGANLEQREQIGPYRVVECIGQGGMGAVYLAQEEGVGPIVAVKVTLADKAEADAMSRFEREAKLCSMLNHPNLVTLLDEGQTEDGLRFMVIPFFTGKDLKTVLEQAGGILEPQLAFHIFEQTLAGLEHVHQQKIVHRDLKPENLFIISGDERAVKVVDFGIARLMDDDKPPADQLFRSRAGVISGSPAYIAPETISGDAIDPRTDIYSLGIMFFQMLTGRLPLYGESAYDYLREHVVGVPLTLFQGKKDSYWSPGIETLMAGMLAKERSDRPASCQSILDELKGGLLEETLHALENPPEEEEETSASIFNSFFKMIRR